MMVGSVAVEKYAGDDAGSSIRGCLGDSASRFCGNVGINSRLGKFCIGVGSIRIRIRICLVNGDWSNWALSSARPKR